jgi:hypothetical protein
MKRKECIGGCGRLTIAGEECRKCRRRRIRKGQKLMHRLGQPIPSRINGKIPFISILRAKTRKVLKKATGE